MTRVAYDEFQAAIRGSRRAWHIEMSDTYNVEAEDEPFERFLSGAEDDYSWLSEWLGFISEVTANGTRVQRARLVTVPHTDYIRWGLACAAPLTAAGRPCGPRSRRWPAPRRRVARWPDWRESVEYIRGRLGTGDEAGSDRLADAVGDLPLAIAEAVGWQLENPTPLGDFVDLLGQQMGSSPCGSFAMRFTRRTGRSRLPVQCRMHDRTRAINSDYPGGLVQTGLCAPACRG